MEINFKDTALEDIAYFKKSGNKQIQKKITELIADIMLHPETGLGKPEQLKHEFAGYWSRRLDDTHRIVYRVSNNTLYILSLRGHYFK